MSQYEIDGLLYNNSESSSVTVQLYQYNFSVISEVDVQLSNVAVPVISPSACTFADSIDVTISCETEGAIILYTLDETPPHLEYTLLSSIPITQTTTVRAMASKPHKVTSYAEPQTYTQQISQVATPTFLPLDNTFTGSISVAIDCTTNGAQIKFTFGDELPTQTSGWDYLSPLLNVTTTTTINAIAFAPGMTPSNVANITYTQLAVAQPIIKKEGDNTPLINGAQVTVIQGTTITGICDTPDARIYYTSDGSEPTENPNNLFNSMRLGQTQTGNQTFKFKAFKAGYVPSSLIEIIFTINPNYVAIPQISPSGCTFAGSIDITISCETEGATILYTLDETSPHLEYTPLSSIPIAQTTTVNVMASKEYMTTNYAVAQTYTQQVVALPIITREGNGTPVENNSSINVNQGTRIIATCATVDAIIRYTDDNTEPTQDSRIFANSRLNQTQILTFKAFKDGLIASNKIKVTFVVNPVYVNTPIMSSNGDTYLDFIDITIACATEGAIIKYTLDGTQPNLISSPEYIPLTSIHITQTTIVKAIAFKDFMTASDIASQTYTIQSLIGIELVNSSSDIQNIRSISATIRPFYLSTNETTIEVEDIYQFSLAPYEQPDNWEDSTITYQINDPAPSVPAGMLEQVFVLKAKIIRGIQTVIVTKQIFIDEKKPITLANKVSGPCHGQSLAVNLGVIDYQGNPPIFVQPITYYTLDGSNPNPNNGFVYNGEIQIHASGFTSTTILKYVSIDAAGNIETPNWTNNDNTRIYTFDLVPPQITLVDINNSYLHIGESASIIWQTNKICKRKILEIGGSGNLHSGTVISDDYINISANTEQTTVIPAETLPSGGPHTLYLYCIDEHDNIGYVTFSLTFDNQVPNIQIHEVYRHTLALHDTATIIWTSNIAGNYDVRRGGSNPGEGYPIIAGAVTAGQIMETPVTSDQLLYDVVNKINIYVITPGGTIGFKTTSMTVNSLPPTANVNIHGSEGPFINPIIVVITADDFVAPGIVTDANDFEVDEDFSIFINPMMRPNVANLITEANEESVIEDYNYVHSDIANVVVQQLGLQPYDYNFSEIANTTVQFVVTQPVIKKASDNISISDGSVVVIDQGSAIIGICDIAGAIIYYTTDGNIPTENSSVFSGSIRLNENTVLTLKAFKAGLTPSASIHVHFTVNPVYVAIPIINPDTGLFTSSVEVAIACATLGATIRYTLDDTQPNPYSSQEYQLPLQITQTTIVRAVAFKEYMTASYAESRTYTVQLPIVAQPIIQKNSEILADYSAISVNQGTLITGACTTPDVIIRYTINGTEPTEASDVFSGSIYLDQSITLVIKAFKNNFTPSPSIHASFTVVPVYVATPAIVPNSGMYINSVDVEITCATSNAIIRYTTDGTQPNPYFSPEYTSPLHVTQNTAVHAIATHQYMTPSLISERAYTIQAPSIAQPVFKYENNIVIPNDTQVTVNQGTLILIECPVQDAVIRYTLDGNEPNEDSSILYGSIFIDQDETITLKAFKNGFEPSPSSKVVFVAVPIYVQEPEFTPIPGNFSDSVDVVIACATPNAIIRYTTDGSLPTTSSTIYTEPINITTTTVINALATKTHMTSNRNGAIYRITVANTPEISNIVIHSYRTSCVIKWNTNVLCTGHIDYGITSSYNLLVNEFDLTLKTQHVVVLTNLTPDRLYHFSVKGQSIDAIPVQSTDQVFSTSANRDTRIAIYATTDGTLPTTSHSTQNSFGQQLDFNINTNTILQFFAVDGFGNQQEIQKEIYTLDVNPPNIIIDHLMPLVIGVNGIAVLRFKVSEAARYSIKNQIGTVLATNENVPEPLAPDIWISARLYSADMVEGLNHLTITAKDIYGNANTLLVGHIVRDTIPPEIEPNKLAGYYNTDIYVDLVPKNPREGEHITIYYTLDGSLPSPDSFRSGIGENQIYNIRISETTTIRWYSVDEVGNEELKKYATYVIDRQKPLVMATPLPGIYEEVLEIQLTANKPSTIYYTIDGTMPTDNLNERTYIYNPRRPLQVLQDTTIICFAKDLAGNISDVQEFSYEIKTLQNRNFKKVIGFQDKMLLETEFNEAQDNINRRIEEMISEVVGNKSIIHGFDIQKPYGQDSFDFYVLPGKAYIGGKFVTISRSVQCSIPASLRSNVDRTLRLILRPKETIFKPTRPGQPGWEEGVTEITTYRLEENYLLEIIENTVLPEPSEPYIELNVIVKPASALSIHDCQFIDNRGYYTIDTVVDFQNQVKTTLNVVETNILALGLEVESFKLRNLLGLKNAFVDTFESLKDVDTTKSQKYRYVNTRFEL